MPHNSSTYRITGLSCVNCSKTFELNLKRLAGVDDAHVNFAAEKVSITGEVTIEDIEKAGAFDGIKVVQDVSEPIEHDPFWQRNARLMIAGLLILVAFAGQYFWVNEAYLTTTLLVVSIVIGGINLFKSGLINLTRLRFDMHTLMTIAVIGAAIIGEWKEAAVVVILFAISEALETYSMDKARASIQSLIDIAPKQALIRRNGVEQSIDIKDIIIGDMMLVKPGDKIAMDGEIAKGSSSINQSSITGESIPVDKKTADEVYAGTINQDGFLEVRVTKIAEDATIAKIIHLVEEAQAEKAPSEAFVDRFAAYYTPAIILIAVLVAIIPSFLTGEWSTWVYQGLAVLVVGCPCALVISTPVAIVTAIGTAARNGVLIKGGIHLEQMGGLKSIAFDKTGTLTKGKPEVTDTQTFTDDQQALGYLAALENKSGHPLARAVTLFADNEKIDYQSIEVVHFSTVQGKGIQGEINGEVFYAGSPSFFKELNADLMATESIDTHVDHYRDEGKTIILCGTKNEIYSIIALRDQPRDESESIIQRLHGLGIKHSFMLTGDHVKTATALSKELGVTDVEAGLLPEDKLTFIKKYEKEYGSIAMVGDGINDTPALAASTVGIAMGSAGTDSALETADIALMGDDLKKVPFTVNLSRRALNIIKQNIGFSIGIKLLALLLVIPGWLTLWIAIFSDMGATLIVTLNALRLLKSKAY